MWSMIEMWPMHVRLHLAFPCLQQCRLSLGKGLHAASRPPITHTHTHSIFRV